MLEDLIEIGFKKVGEINLVDNRLEIDIKEEAQSRNVLYSFIIDNEPVYIGKTIQPLKKRMYGYINPGKSQLTNIRNNANLFEAIKNNFKVELFVLPDHGLLHFGKFHLNLAAGLEDSIVKTLAPKWNLTGK